MTFRPLPFEIDVDSLKQREAELAQIMADLVEDLSAKIIERMAYLAGTAKIRAELEDVRAELADAGTRSPVQVIDVEAAYDEFGQLDLGEQRLILREAFEFIRIVPRGKGRPKQGAPVWRSELIQTNFTPAWS